jgi:hypothetical protein
MLPDNRWSKYGQQVIIPRNNEIFNTPLFEPCYTLGIVQTALVYKGYNKGLHSGFSYNKPDTKILKASGKLSTDSGKPLVEGVFTPL